jgi:CcmD family protein
MKDGLEIVLAVNLVIWLGLAAYLFILDRKIKRLEDLAESGEE